MFYTPPINFQDSICDCVQEMRPGRTDRQFTTLITGGLRGSYPDSFFWTIDSNAGGCVAMLRSYLRGSKLTLVPPTQNGYEGMAYYGYYGSRCGVNFGRSGQPCGRRQDLAAPPLASGLRVSGGANLASTGRSF